MCAQRKKWSVENFKFSETDFSRPVQRFANHWQEGSGERILSSPRAVRQRIENTTNPSHRIMLVRATTKRSQPSDTCAKSTHPPFQSGSCRVCALSYVRDRQDWRARAPACVCQRRPRQLLSLLCLAELHWFCGLVFLFTQDFASCPSRLSALQAGITPICTFLLSLSTSHSSVFRGAVERGYMPSLNVSVIRVFTVFPAMFCALKRTGVRQETQSCTAPQKNEKTTPLSCLTSK